MFVVVDSCLLLVCVWCCWVLLDFLLFACVVVLLVFVVDQYSLLCVRVCCCWCVIGVVC